ncbi:MAG: hypothetical protein R6U88_07060 [Candidatus Bipolaricaulota bacterium]
MSELKLLEPTEISRTDWDMLLRSMAEGLDPWEVDLVELLRRFREHMAAFAALELEVPGRMVLAGAVLLRMKSEWVRNDNGNGQGPTLDEVVDQVSEEPEYEPNVYVAPELRLPIVRRSVGRSTVRDLHRALRAALGHGQRKREQPGDGMEFEQLGVDLEREPFTGRAVRLLRRLVQMVNGERVVPFKRLLGRSNRRDEVARFMELLHLDAQGSVRVYQEEFLGEVLVEVVGDGSGAS